MNARFPGLLVAALVLLGAPAGLAQPAPAPEEKQRIVLMGDSLAEGLAPTLAEALQDLKSIEIVKRTKGSSGFVRDDFYDWRRGVREILAEGKVAGVVILIGSNDRQAIQTPSGRLPPLSDAWRAEYQARLDDVLSTLTQAGPTVYWVGLPPMPSGRTSSDINEIFRERAAAAGANFIDVWDAFVDADGRFTPLGPDLSGTVRRLRASDGVHFTRAGYEKLAHFVEQEIRRDFASEAEEPAPSGLVPQVSLPGPGPAPAAPAGAGESAAAPGGPAESAPAVTAAPKVEAGPVTPLTGPAPGEDTLLGASASSAATAASAGPPKPGRADDARWPR